MTHYDTILYEKQRRGVLITLNRPHVLNALDERLWEELDDALEEARKDAGIRAVVLTGASGVFSTGEDISGDDRSIEWPYGIPANASLVDEYDKLRDQDRKSFLERQIYRWEYPKPIIAAVRGWCLGAASGLALSCHLTFAADDAVFGQPQIRHASGTDFIWVLLAGFKNALRYSLTGDPIDAQEALRIGLVNRVLPKEQLLDGCFAYVERIALVPPETVKINLHIARMGLEMMGLRKAWLLNSELSAMARLTKDEEFNKKMEEARKQRGLKAFFETRDAPFQPEPFGPRAKES